MEYLATKTEVAEAKGELKEGLARVNSILMVLVPLAITAIGAAFSVVARS